MANYYEKARTNYFKVKDIAAFNDWANKFTGLDVVVQEQEGTVSILFDEESGVPSFYYDENDQEIEVDFMEELAKHLADDSVAVLEAVGSEKCRYLNGYAVAVNNKGESVSINLDMIYELAKQKFGAKEISKAMY